MNKNKYTIAYDLGVSSIGYAVIHDKTKKIMESGVEKFSENESFADRGAFRRSARTQSRAKTRVNDLIKIFKLQGWNVDFKQTQNHMQQLRVKSLTQKISKQELFNILKYYMTHRGYIPFYTEDELQQHQIIKENSDKYPAEIELIILKQNNVLKNGDFVFLNSQISKELQTILKTQELSNSCLSSILAIFNRKRNFADGPGSSDSYTKYGLYNGSSTKKTLWDDAIGRCNVYYNEKRAPRASYEAERFNILNDFINLKFFFEYKPDDTFFKEQREKDATYYKLTTNALNLIIEYMLSAKSVNYKSMMKKLFDVKIDVDNTYGYRVDKKGKMEFSKFTAIKKLIDMEFSLGKSKYIIDTFALFTGDDAILSLRNENILSIDEIQLLIDNKFKIPDLKTGYHSYSYKALNVYSELMLQHTFNSSKVSREFANEINSNTDTIKIQKVHNNLDNTYIDALELVPGTATKTLNQMIKLTNYFTNKYGLNNLSNVVLEGNNSFLSIKEKNELTYKQGENEKKKSEAIKNLESKKYDITPNNIMKEMLLIETNHVCAYCLKPLTLDNMETEHIYPISKSFDNSFVNKTASCRKCNKDKGNLLPIQFIGKDINNNIKTFKNMPQLKKEQLTMVPNEKQSLSFKARHLNDTMMITSSAKRMFNMYARKNKLKFQTLVVSPLITTKYRQDLDLPKDRDFVHHHAVDAAIVGLFSYTKLGLLQKEFQNSNNSFWKIIKSEQVYDLINKGKINPAIKEILLKITCDTINFNKQMIRKTTGAQSTADILKVRQINGENYKLVKQSNLYSNDIVEIKKCIKIFIEKPETIYSYNESIVNELVKIASTFDGENNPFVQQLKDNEKYLKINGIIIKSFYTSHLAGNIKEYDYKNNNKKDSTIITKRAYTTKHFNLYMRQDGTHFMYPVYKNEKDSDITYETFKHIAKCDEQDITFIKKMHTGERMNVLVLRKDEEVFYNDVFLSGALSSVPRLIFYNVLGEKLTAANYIIK